MSEEPKKFEVIDRRIEAEVPARVEYAGPNAIVLKAMDKGYSPEFISRMLDLQERYEANEARKAFFVAKSAFKAEAPVVRKDKVNPQFKSQYSSDDALFNTLNPYLSKHGLEASFVFPASDIPGTLSATCILAHSMGHTESVTVTSPVDTSGAKNPVQQIKSTYTYLKKATYEAILGIASSDHDADDDGNSASAEPATITPEQVKVLEKLIAEKEADLPKFCKWAKIERLEDMKAGQFNAATTLLKAKKKAEPKPVREREPGED